MSVKSAVRVVRIFELLSNHPDGLTVKEISKELSLPQSSTFNLAATLLDEGYLQQDAIKRYRLGAKLIQVGTAAMESIDISSQGVPFLKQLMDGVQETVFMAVLSDDQLVYSISQKSITTGQSEQPHSPVRANRFIAPGLARHFWHSCRRTKGKGCSTAWNLSALPGIPSPPEKSWKSSCRHFWNRDMPLTMKKMKKVCFVWRRLSMVRMA